MRPFLFLMLFLPVFFLQAESKKLTLIHSNDLHSHMDGFSPALDYTPLTTSDDKTRGGYARIASLVKTVREKRTHPVLFVDGGDFSMGSLFHLPIRKTGFELNLMKEIGMDITTIGNHEFDFGPAGLADILRSAKKNGPIPLIVNANLRFHPDDKRDDSLQEFFKDGTVQPYQILVRDGIKIGVFGGLGVDAVEVAPNSKPLHIIHPVESARQMVKILREKKVDIIIYLSHGGIWADKEKSEDEITAQEVDGIDVIISGHTSNPLMKPILLNDTIIVHTGAYGANLGIIDLEIENGRVSLQNYELKPVDDTIAGDPMIHQKIGTYVDYINETFLKEYRLSFYEKITQTEFDLVNRDDTESNIGNLVADSIRWSIDKYTGGNIDKKNRVHIGIETNGVIRDNLLRGKKGVLTVSDAFIVMPLGIGRDEKLGYPLVSVYSYASEVKDALEIMTTVAPLKDEGFNLQLSGIQYRYNPHRMMFNRVTDIWIENDAGKYEKIDFSKNNKTLYRVGVNIYNATLLSLVEDFTRGILAIQLRDKNGKPIKDLHTAIVDMDKDKPGIQELKQWFALVEYMKSFADTNGDGLANMPASYQSLQGRIQKKPDNSFSALIANPSGLTIAFVGLGVTLLFFLSFTIRFFVKKMLK